MYGRHALPAALVAGFGVLLLVAGVGYHAAEIRHLAWAPGPLLAMSIDTVPALGLIYAGYRLTDSDFDPEQRWVVCAWTFVGSAAFLGVVWATIVVRRLEGRIIGEPWFPLLVAAVTGAVAGYVAGHFHARARASAREARTVADGFAFVNSFIRHDLQNDLSTIRGYAETLDAADADGTPDLDSAAVIEEKADDALTRIETSNAVAETLVDDAPRERVDLTAVAADIVESADATYTVDVTADLPPTAPVAANAGVRSVVDNLVENAVEHNDADDPRVHVEVEPGEDTMRLTVRDNGPGVPDDRKRAVQDGAESLTGGIRLVRTLVDRYGGAVCVEDNDPRGTAFVVELQRWQGAAASGTGDGAGRNSADGGGGAGGAEADWQGTQADWQE